MATNIIGKSQKIKDVLKLIDQVAGSNTSVLVVGESGTGKELVARRIHELSSVSARPFVSVNCGAIPENLIESEMFGHQKGSFTGAVVDKAGLFEVANGGTFFLDEIGELPLSMQVKMLRVIQERTFRRVGGTKDITVEVRIIAATNRNLEDEISTGRFREDLYYRLNVIMIRTPPLRERKEDIPLLAEFFLRKVAEKHRRKLKGFDKQALKLLSDYAFPGNVRELENVVERAVTLESSDKIQIDVLPTAISGIESVTDVELSSNKEGKPDRTQTVTTEYIRVPVPDFSRKKNVNLDQVLGDVEKRYLHDALLHSKGIKKRAAEVLGITFRSFRYRLKKHGLEDES